MIDSFPQTRVLYIQKQTQHDSPKLLIMNHAHEHNEKRELDHESPSKPKRPTVSELDEDLEVIDEHKFDGGKKRKRAENNDSNIQDLKKPRIEHQQDKDDLEDIAEYNDDVIFEWEDDDGKDNTNLKIDDVHDRPNKNKKNLNYKHLYAECFKSNKKLRVKIKKILESNNRRYKDEKSKLQQDLQNQKSHYKEKIVKLKRFHETQMTDLDALKEGQCNDKLDEVERKYNDKLVDMQAKHKNDLEFMEAECKDKVKKLSDHIKSIQEDDASLNTLTDAIFNCTTMEEIFEIQKLVKNHQIDFVIEKHLKTLQNLFLSLSFGILPVCQAQRKKVTDKQRKLVERIQSSSGHYAKRIIKSNREDITNLFEIIDDSLKLARNSFNRFGIE